jgi:flagellar biosynthetic protein FliR
MNDLFGITVVQFETWLLVFIRVSTMLQIFPIFSSPQVPILLRLGFGMVLSFVLMHVVPMLPGTLNVYELLLSVVSQVALGAIVGFVAQLVFSGIQFAGELLDLQIGFAIANVINPQTQQSITIVGEFMLAIATLVFLGTDSHFFFIQGIAGSFNLVPLPYISLDPSVGGNVVLFFTESFLIVFKIAAPIAVALMITNIGLAFMAKVAPQMNVFVVGLPIQVGIGLIMLAVSIPLVGTVGPELFQAISTQMDTVMRGLRAQ